MNKWLKGRFLKIRNRCSYWMCKTTLNRMLRFLFAKSIKRCGRSNTELWNYFQAKSTKWMVVNLYRFSKLVFHSWNNSLYLPLETFDPIWNKLRLCTSCESLKHIDTNWSQRVMRDARYHRVPIPPDINFNSVIHGATDNFDDDPCHITILMLFQNQSKKSLSKSVKVIDNQNQSRKPQQTLTCLKTIKIKKQARSNSDWHFCCCYCSW